MYKGEEVMMITISLSQQERKKKILVVDDEHDMTAMLKMALTIDTYNDPVLALEGFKPNHYDLVILDFMMPKMDGFDLYNKLKWIDHDIKICFLTASNET